MFVDFEQKNGVRIALNTDRIYSVRPHKENKLTIIVIGTDTGGLGDLEVKGEYLEVVDRLNGKEPRQKPGVS